MRTDPGQIHLLMYGEDRLLLETRANVLRSAGYMMRSVHSMDEARNQVGDGVYALLVLCHTTPLAFRPAIQAAADACGVPIYQICGLMHPRELILELERALSKSVPDA